MLEFYSKLYEYAEKILFYLQNKAQDKACKRIELLNKASENIQKELVKIDREKERLITKYFKEV